MKITNSKGKWYLLDDRKDEIVLTPLDENMTYATTKQSQKTRTYLANAALHKYFSLTATALNDAGYSVQYVLNRKRDAGIEKAMTWLHEQIGDDRVIKVKDKILSHKDASISWTGENVKNLLWRTFQKALVGKESTTQINSKDIDLIHRELDKYLSTTYGIESIPFPSQEELIFQQNYKDKK